MKKNHLFAKLHTGGVKPLRVVAILLFLCAAFGTAVAQTGSAQLDVSRLVGADPADIINTDNTHRVTPNNAAGRKYTFLLLNVGTEKFFNIGGAYGRHATLNDYGMYLWIFKNSTTAGTYNIRTRQNYVAATTTDTGNPDNADSYVQYINNNDTYRNGVYPDANPTDANRAFGWFFEKADGYSAENKVYKIKTYGDRYLTAIPDDADGNLCEATTGTPSNANYQVWKLVTLEEYCALLDDSPSDSKNPVDITFLLNNPGFNYNRGTMSSWKPLGDAHYVRFGIEGYYKKATEAYYKNNDGIEIGYTDYLFEYGKYFCADIQGSTKNGVDQWVPINKPGYYVIRCKGFSNTNGLAELYVKEAATNNFGYGEPIIAKTPLKSLPQVGGPTNLLEAGKAFYDDKNNEYENEVKIYIPKDLIEIFNETSLIIGVSVSETSDTKAWTAFDDFRLLYYGESETPELVLDEDNPDLKYLTETIDEYNNTKLHLKRSFSLNKWNTLILPVNLTYGQMKNAFGTDVLVAKLHELNENSVRFQTVGCNSDDDIMLEAFTPYIIKPTEAPADATDYTTPRLKKTANQYWFASGVGLTNDEDGVTRYTSGQVAVNGKHYSINGVTLDRSLFGFDEHWVSKTVTMTNASTSGMGMACKGTLAKTYYVNGNKGVFYTDGGETRDNLAGDYFMNKGEMWKVPEGKQYGLKAFRCWFELTNGTDATLNSTAPAKDVLLYIDGIADNATAIEDVEADPIFSNAKAAYADGVYNLYGQRVRNGSSLEGLPEGIYIVKGKKVKK